MQVNSLNNKHMQIKDEINNQLKQNQIQQEQNKQKQIEAQQNNQQLQQQIAMATGVGLNINLMA